MAMETFLDNTKDKDGKDVTFEDFKRNYPIYDFGQNHKGKKDENVHDCYINGLSDEGFDYMKTRFVEILREFGIEYTNTENGHMITPIKPNNNMEKEQFFTSIQSATLDLPNRWRITDYTKILQYLSQRNLDKEGQLLLG